MSLDPVRYRLPAEWFGVTVSTSPIHNTTNARGGFMAVSSIEKGSKGLIAYFQTVELEEFTLKPVVANVVDEALHQLLVHLGWTPPAANS